MSSVVVALQTLDAGRTQYLSYPHTSTSTTRCTLSKQFIMRAWGCGSVFPTIKTYPKDPTAVTQYIYYTLFD